MKKENNSNKKVITRIIIIIKQKLMKIMKTLSKQKKEFKNQNKN